MKQRLVNYMNDINDTLSNPPQEIDWNKLKASHLVQIQFFQHERLIHLIVTVTFAILTILSTFAVIITQYMPLLALTLLFFVLLIPYIGHYYTLENGVQKLYEYYDQIEEKLL